MFREQSESRLSLSYLSMLFFFIPKVISSTVYECVCDEWSGAESRGNGASPGGVNDNELTPAPLTGLESHGGASEGLNEA